MRTAMTVQSFYDVFKELVRRAHFFPSTEEGEEGEDCEERIRGLLAKVGEALRKQKGDGRLLAGTELASDAVQAFAELCVYIDGKDPDGRYSELAGFTSEAVPTIVLSDAPVP